MTITLKCFAYLRQYLPPDANSNVIAYEIEEGTSIQQLIQQLNIDADMVELAILNDVFVEPQQRNKTILQPADTLALWPEVAGG